MNLAILALALSAFGIGTSEFVIMGILPEVSHSLNVSIPQAGLLVSVYAIGVAVGAPLLTILTRRIQRRNVLSLLLITFIIGNILCALSYSYYLMMFSRIVTSFTQGTFFGIGAVVASRIVAPEKRASAIAAMFTGITVANITGVPFGTWLSQYYDWHLVFWLIAIIGAAAFISVIIFVPNVEQDEPINFKNEIRAVFKKETLLALLSSILVAASIFTIFTYIVIILLQVSFVPKGWISGVLLAIGVGSTIGITWGGKLADRKGIYKALNLTVAMTILVSLILIVSSSWQLTSIVTLFFWGILSFSVFPALQLNIVKAAHDAPNISSTLNIGAFNVGNAIGAYLGGLPLVFGLSSRYCIVVAVILIIPVMLVIHQSAKYIQYR